MPRHAKLSIGQRFGMLVVAGDPRLQGRSLTWVVKCDCGRELRMYSRNIQKNTSCGCARSKLIGAAKRTHGMSNTPEYTAWCSMISRCEQPSTDSYQYYGARGIKVCPTWRDSFASFYADMGDRPSRKHSVERRDTAKDYAPENCHWATTKEQNHNRRTSVFIDIAGEHIHLKDAADKYGVNYHTLYTRIFSRGWSVDRALGITWTETKGLCATV